VTQNTDKKHFKRIKRIFRFDSENRQDTGEMLSIARPHFLKLLRQHLPLSHIPCAKALKDLFIFIAGRQKITQY